MIKNYREIFGNIDTTPYREAVERFLPDKIKVLFIFESPPFPPPIHPVTKEENPDWYYFYRFETKGSNNLRKEVCSAVFNEKVTDHEIFLSEFCKTGYFLIDAVDYPINKIIKKNSHLVKLASNGEVDNRERENIICSEANSLINTIEYQVEKSGSDIDEIKMILVKFSVFNGLMVRDNLFSQLVNQGRYNVLNTSPIPFPMVPNNKKFIADVRNLLELTF
jgi:hypothetical protein